MALLLAALALLSSPALAQSPPDTPSSVAVDRSDGSLTASWKAPARAESYHVTYSSDGGKSWSLAALNHRSNSITISGVDNSKSYIVGVRARNSAGGSGWRNSYAIGPYNPPAPPPTPKPPATPGVITVSRSDGALHAFWNSVGGATGYHVTYTGDNGASWSLAALNHPAGNGTTSITISGVDNSKSYIVGVRARNSAGDSGWRNSSSIGRYEPPPAPPKPPSVPTSLSATGSDKSVTLSWSKPVGDVTGYQFRFRAAPPAPGWGDWHTVPDGDGDTTSYTIHKLENGTEYRFKLRAVNSGAVSAPAPTSAPWYVSATPDSNVQPPPSSPSAPPAPSSVTATRGTGTIVASWYHSKGATGYDVRYSTDNGSTWKLAAWHWNTSVITIKGASDDKSYIVGVRARNLVGASDWTNSNTVEALPDPNLVSVSNLGEAASDNYNVGQVGNVNHQLAGGFTTGSSSNGYTLESVTVRVQSVFLSPTGLSMAVHAVSGGNPAAQATHALTGTSPTAAGDVTYTCSGSCSLDAGTTYFLVLSGTGPTGQANFYYIYLTESNNETNAPTGAGWSIANGAKKKQTSGIWRDYGVGNQNEALMFKVTATEK